RHGHARYARRLRHLPAFRPGSPARAARRRRPALRAYLRRRHGSGQAAGPQDSLLREPEQIRVDFLIHRDREANAAVIEIQGRRVVLRAGGWSRWTKINFRLSTPWFMLGKSAGGICRFYLQEVAPNFRLYVSPINIDPSDPAVRMSEPDSFIQDVSAKLGLFHTTGFQEAYEACKS